MALLPVALKRRLVNRADLVGSPLIHLLALILAPHMYLKQLSMRRGILGRSSGWKVVAVVVYGGGTLKRFLGKNPKPLEARKLGPGAVMHVLTATPMPKKQRKQLGINKQVLTVQAVKDADEAMELFHPS